MGSPRLPLIPGLSELAGLARHFEFRAVSRWVGLGSIVGVLSGLAAAALYAAVEFVRYVVLSLGAGYHALEPDGEPALFGHVVEGGEVRTWVVVLAPAVGGFLAGLIVWWICPEARGGNDGWIRAFHQGQARVRRRVALAKWAAASLFLGMGNSAGREGPIAHIGASLGATVARGFRLTDRERRLLVIAGAAGGIGAIFRTPLGGALFIVEVLYSDDLEVDALVPALLSSVVAYSVFTTLFGEGNLFATPQTYQFDPRQLPLYLLMAVGVALVGAGFIALHHKVAHITDHARLFYPLRPALGGLAVGGLALIHPSALGAGYGWMQEALRPTGLIPAAWAGVLTLLLIAAVKVVATSISASTGAAAGVFGPSVVIGGMVGGAFGLAFHEWFPEVVREPSAFMIVGMACFVGGVTHAPISTLVMASEMTGSYELLVPIMLAEVVTFTLIRRWGIYAEVQVATRKDSPAHGAEYVFDVLQDIEVDEVFERTELSTVHRSMPLSRVLRQATQAKQAVFPVVDDAGKPEGIVTLESLRAFIYDEDLGKLAIAADCESPFVSVAPTDSLATALERMAESHYQQLPVLDAAKKVVGVVSYEALLQAYSSELARRRFGAEEPKAV